MYSTLAGSNLVSPRDRSFVVLVFPLFLPPCTTTLVERVGGASAYFISFHLACLWPGPRTCPWGDISTISRKMQGCIAKIDYRYQFDAICQSCLRNPVPTSTPFIPHRWMSRLAPSPGRRGEMEYCSTCFLGEGAMFVLHNTELNGCAQIP